MRLVTALALAMLSATPALAQTAPSPAVATAPFSADTPLASVVADPAAKAVLLKNLPDIDKHPAWDQFKSMSLRQLQPFAADKISTDLVAKIDAELKALPTKP